MGLDGGIPIFYVIGLRWREPRQNPRASRFSVVRYCEPLLDTFGNTARLPGERIELLNAQHVHQLGVQAPGTWISRGSGQEHLTALRSPVLTGPGACGAFLMLEDGIPLRPTGFCNVNQLFETPSELASSAEVLRGPGNALYGSNSLHGTLNFLLPGVGTSIFILYRHHNIR